MARRSQSASRAAQASAAKSATSGASTAAKRPASSTISNAASAVAVARAAATGCNTRSTAAVGRRSDNSIATATGVSAVNGPSLAPETASSDSAPKRSSRLAGKKVPATAGVASTRLTVRQKPGKKAAPTKRTGRALTTEAGEHNAAGVRFTAFSVPVLKGKLQGLGLSTDGRKTALVARLVSGSASNDASTASSAADPKRDRGSYNPSRHSNIVDAHIHADMAVIKAASGPTLSGPRMFDPECHSKVVALLGNVDTSVLLNLPATFNGFKEAIAPVFGRADDIKVRFRGYVEEQRAVWSRQNPDKRPEGSATTFKLPNEAAEHFFRAIGATHGSRTKNYTCDKDDCTEQSCCPQEYNFSTVSTYAERLAADAEFTDHAGIFTSKAFKAYVRTGETRQQTCGRGSLPAAPILLPHAEAVVAEAKASIVQARADFQQAADTKGRAQAAYNAVRGASCKAVFVVDLCTGKRAADITSTLSADVIFTGTGNHRKIAAYNRTNKVLLPVRPWMVDARPTSILCPIKAIDEYLAVCREFGVPIGKLCNGDGGTTPCSCYFFPFISKDKYGYPCVTNNRAGRSGFQANGWEHVTTSQCNAWLKQMLERLGGTVTTDYTFHGSRSVAALVALAEGTSIDSINSTHGWKARSEQARSYARLVQLQSMTQEPLLRDTLASTLLAGYSSFFK